MKYPHFIIVILLSTLLYQSCVCTSSDATYVYLVRHADKGGKDSLSLEGIERAYQLKHLLVNSQINTVFSTDYNRTKDTAHPLATSLNKKVKIYNAKTLDVLAKEIKDNYKGKRLLVVGHSNTTPSMVNLLLNNESLSSIDEKEYDKLYLVVLNQCGKSELVEMQYGVESPKKH